MEKGVKRRSLGLELSLSLDIPQHSLIRLELATLSAALDPPPPSHNQHPGSDQGVIVLYLLIIALQSRDSPFPFKCDASPRRQIPRFRDLRTKRRLTGCGQHASYRLFIL